MNNGQAREVTFNITEKIGVLSINSTGWKKELNLVSWNGNPPKYDIREWSPDYLHMSRGVTLHEQELNEIIKLMRKRKFDSRQEAKGANEMSSWQPRQQTQQQTQSQQQTQAQSQPQPETAEFNELADSQPETAEFNELADSQPQPEKTEGEGLC